MFTAPTGRRRPCGEVQSCKGFGIRTGAQRLAKHFCTQPMSTPTLQMQSGRIVATLAFKGEEKLAINIPSTSKISANVVGLKRQVVEFLSQHMAASNLANDEVDMLEEVVSDEEEVPRKGKSRQKRKRELK